VEHYVAGTPDTVYEPGEEPAHVFVLQRVMKAEEVAAQLVRPFDEVRLEALFGKGQCCRHAA
jgi:hypothetical protein